jgi:clan AA aspartic protease (TIGR02281 family)
MKKAIMLVLLAFGSVHAESIKLIREHGTFMVPLIINGSITLNFTIDSGAADVSIPADVFSTMTRAGTVSKSDFLDMQEYELADGSRQTSQRFRIRSLRIGSFELKNVVASVAPSAGTLLLGQSFLTRLKSWSIDNDRQLLVFDESTYEGPEVRPRTRTDVGIDQGRYRSSPPMSNDVHAAYCTEIIRWRIRLSEQALSKPPSSPAAGVPDTESLQESRANVEAANVKLKASLDYEKASLRRLNLFLQLRLTDSDLTTRDLIGIVGTTNRAKNDISRMLANTSCTYCAGQQNTGEITACMNECMTQVMPDYPSIQTKVKSCDSLDWLPF